MGYIKKEGQAFALLLLSFLFLKGKKETPFNC